MGKYLKNDTISEIIRVVEYLWCDEKRHWLECEEDIRKNHIYNSLCKIKNDLNIGIKNDEEDEELEFET